MSVVGITYRASRAPRSCCGLVYQPHDIPSAVAQPLFAAAALGTVPAIRSQWLHESPRPISAREGDQEHSVGRNRLQLASLSESLARDIDVCGRLGLGDRLSTAAESLCTSSFARAVVDYSGTDYLAKAARQFASWLQILRLSRTDIPVCPFSATPEFEPWGQAGMPVLPWFKEFDSWPVRVEHLLGILWALSEWNRSGGRCWNLIAQILHFGLHLNYQA